MSVSVEIIKLSPREDQNIDYETTIFKVTMGKKVNLESSREYWVLFKTLIEGGCLKVLLDFKNCEYIDSAGIGNLVRAAKLIRSNKGMMYMANVPQEINEVFKMINLHNLIEGYNNEVEAVNAFRYIVK